MSGELLLTVEEAANRLRIGRTVMYSLVRTNQIQTIKIGRLRRIPVDALKRYVAGLSELELDAVTVESQRDQSQPPSRFNR